VWVPVLVAVIACGGTVLGLVFAFLMSLSRRLHSLERRDKLSWLYIRALILSHNIHAPGAPLPEPPDGWLEEAA
jgi:hypothetical protein